MVRFDIVGLNDCPWFAKAVKLADEISSANPRVEFNHEMLEKSHWRDFCDKMKHLRGWTLKNSPVVYEVLVDTNGKALLIGDCHDFCDFAAMYFDIFYDPPTSALEGMAITNKSRFGHGFGGHDRGDAAVFNIAIVNPSLKLLELLLTQLMSPISMIPPGVLLHVRVYESERIQNRLEQIQNFEGLLMEVMDMASPSLFKVSLCSTMSSCFSQCHLLILAEDLSRGVTEEKVDWICRVELNTAEIIEAINDKRTKMSDTRILVGGNGPQCYIAEMLRGGVIYSKSGPGRIVASGQYIVQKAKAELSKVGNVPSGCLNRIHAWGWPGETGAYIEVKDAVVKGAELAVRGPGVEIPLVEVARNCDYIFTKFSKEFLRLQRKALKYTFPQPTPYYMPIAESILNTVHIWLASEPPLITPSPSDSPDHKSRHSNRTHIKFQDNNNNVRGTTTRPFAQASRLAPILNVGVPVTFGSEFPEGTFMVQPSVCLLGRWQPVGLISDKTHGTVVAEVNKLWVEREALIYRDRDVAPTLFPDFEELTRARSPIKRVAKIIRKNTKDQDIQAGTEDEEEEEGNENDDEDEETLNVEQIPEEQTNYDQPNSLNQYQNGYDDDPTRQGQNYQQEQQQQ